MKTLIYAGILALAIGPVGGALAQDDVDLDVLGNIKGTLDGQPREWLTFNGEVDGEAVASANWQRGVPEMAGSFESMADFIPPEQLAQIEAMGGMPGGENPMAAMMAQMSNGDNPMAAMMAQMGDANPMADIMAQMPGMETDLDDLVTLTISGLDPDSPNMLLERFMVLEVVLGDPDERVSGAAHGAEMHYFLDASSGGPMPDVFYVSGYDDNEASVTFDRLDLQPGGGHASGRFSASLCRLEMKKIMDGPDLSDCIQAEGTFDTKLIEEKPSRS